MSYRTGQCIHEGQKIPLKIKRNGRIEVIQFCEICCDIIKNFPGTEIVGGIKE